MEWFVDIEFVDRVKDAWVAVSSTVSAKQQEWKQYVGTIPTFTSWRYSGSGIVMVADVGLLEASMVSIRMFRESRGNTAIELWYRKGLIDPVALKAPLDWLNIKTREFEESIRATAVSVDFDDIDRHPDTRYAKLKALALIHSSFKDVLLLDPDVIPIVPIDALFQHHTFQSSGCTLWPDYWKSSPANPIWDIIGSKAPASWEQDGSIMLVNKATLWREIHLMLHFSTEYYMPFSNGGKDLLLHACRALGTTCDMIRKRPSPLGMMGDSSDSFCGFAMLQHGHSGEQLFVHHHLRSKEELFDIDLGHTMSAPDYGDGIVRAVRGGRLQRNWDPRPECVSLESAWPPGHELYSARVATVSSSNLLVFSERLSLAWNLMYRAVCDCSELFKVPATPKPRQQVYTRRPTYR